ncbi:cytochrome d ubiquinol oxidase subunit II, partial [Aquitalea sp. ASV15]
GNLLQGVPFHFDDTLRVFYEGSFWALLNPFALLCGLVSASMILLQGATYLMLRTEEKMAERARTAAMLFGVLTIVLFVLGGLWVG